MRLRDKILVLGVLLYYAGLCALYSTYEDVMTNEIQKNGKEAWWQYSGLWTAVAVVLATIATSIWGGDVEETTKAFGTVLSGLASVGAIFVAHKVD